MGTPEAPRFFTNSFGRTINTWRDSPGVKNEKSMLYCPIVGHPVDGGPCSFADDIIKQHICDEPTAESAFSAVSNGAFVLDEILASGRYAQNMSKPA